MCRPPDEGLDALGTVFESILGISEARIRGHRFLLRPDVGAELSRATGFGTPNAAAAGLIENPVPYPTEEERSGLGYQVDLGEHAETWDRIWTETKSA